MTPTDSDALRAAWRAAAVAAVDEQPTPNPAGRALPEQYLVLLTCHDEAEQKALLSRLQAQGLTCRALVS
jgi:hypothetical protein